MRRLIHSNSFDPFYNLAWEQAIFRSLKPKDRVLFLWQSNPCVVIGRYQNPWVETDMSYLGEKGIPLVRRMSGGGTVYHDQGNLNFSFLSHGKMFRQENFDIIKSALAPLEIVQNERHDLLFQGKKVSGSAFKVSRDLFLHHGTLLLQSNLEELRRVLKAPQASIKSKAISSRRSSVINLGPSPIEVINKIKNVFNGNSDQLERDESIFEKNFGQLKDIQWRVGETPKFTLEVSGAEITVKKGLIAKISTSPHHPWNEIPIGLPFNEWWERNYLISL